MFLIKIIYRLIVLGAALGLWQAPEQHVKQQQPALPWTNSPAPGLALRQGRRFSMEDRAVAASALVPCHVSRLRSFAHGSNTDMELRAAAVFDGHGGQAASQFLADSLQQQLLAATGAHMRTAQGCSLLLPNGSASITLQQALTNVVLAANAHFLRRARQAGLDDGSTAVFALVAGQQLLVGNVGNSQALLCYVPAQDPQQEGQRSCMPDVQATKHHDIEQEHLLVSERQQQRQQRRQLRRQQRKEQQQQQQQQGEQGHESEDDDDCLPQLQALPLTKSHVPQRADEKQRIEAAGGRVLHAANAARSSSSGGSGSSRSSRSSSRNSSNDDDTGSNRNTSSSNSSDGAGLSASSVDSKLRLEGELEVSRAIGDLEVSGRH